MRLRHSLCFTLFPVLITAAHAQDSEPADADVSTAQTTSEQGIQRQEERVRTLIDQLDTTKDALRPEQDGPAEIEFPAEQTCFVIHTFELTSRDDARRFQFLLDALEPYRNRCIGVEGLNQIASKLDTRLIDGGFVTSKVSLPQQNLAGGTLTMNVHVGRVESISIHPVEETSNRDEPEVRIKPSLIWRNAFPLRPGDILNIRALEQGVENMQRLPSQSVATQLEPGAQADTTRIEIQVRAPTLRQRLRGGLTLDNSGGRQLGRTQLSAYFSYDNPLGISDLLSASVNSNAQRPEADHRSQSYVLSYSLPYGYSLWTLTQNRNRFAQRVQGTTVQFLSTGESESTELRVAYVLFRTASSKLGVSGALTTRRASSFLDDVELIVQRRRLSYFERGVSYKKLLRTATIEGDIAMRTGQSWFDAQPDLPDAGTGGVTLRPKLWLADVNYIQPFTVMGQPIQFTSHLRGQLTDDSILAADQLSIGGRYTVRGFDGEQSLIAEKGYILRNELSTPLRFTKRIHSSGYFGIDVGRVWGPSDIRLIGNKLVGAALGTRGQFKSLQTDLSIAAPIDKPAQFPTRELNFYGSLTFAF